ncbi:hypothetical protein [Streptomyces sp. NPDC093795]|uniref:hypothetical protein n=1 Tax=Streptomyces sp. NPDC093795 TaxID=3366051 RepID=UPI003820FACD
MNARGGYGSHPEYIGKVLGLLGEDVLLLSYEDQREFAAASLNRFRTIGSARLDWRGAHVVERCEAYDGAALASLLGVHAGPDELVVVFWDNFVVPSIALPAASAARHAGAILDEGYACWILLTDSGILIEFQDGEGMTVGTPPPPSDGERERPRARPSRRPGPRGKREAQ